MSDEDELMLEYTFSDDDDDNSTILGDSVDMEQKQNSFEISLHMTLDDTNVINDDDTNHNTLPATMRSDIDNEETQSNHQQTMTLSLNQSEIQSDASLEDSQTENDDFDAMNEQITIDENKNNQSIIPPIILNTTSVAQQQSALDISDKTEMDEDACDIDDNIENQNQYEPNDEEDSQITIDDIHENNNNQSSVPLILDTTPVVQDQTNMESTLGVVDKIDIAQDDIENKNTHEANVDELPFNNNSQHSASEHEKSQNVEEQDGGEAKEDRIDIDEDVYDFNDNIENKNKHEANDIELPFNDNTEHSVKQGRKRTVEERDEDEEKEDIMNKINMTPPAKKMRHDVSPLRRSKRLQRNENFILLRTGSINQTKVDKENKKLEEMGAIILDEYGDTVTHIIINQPLTTLKFMSGLATATYIVNEDWPTRCIKRGHFAIDERKYFPSKGVKLFEKQYGCILKESFRKRNKRNSPLFEGYKMYFIYGYDENIQSGIEQMAEAHGAECVDRMSRGYDEKLIVIGDDINSKYCKNAKKKGYTVWNKDFVIKSILRQNIELNDNELELK